MTRRIVTTLAGVCLLAAISLGTSARAEGDLTALAWLDEPEPAPDVSFTVEDGEMRTLDDYRGKVIVLNFWAVWCPPCRDEMPSLDRLQAGYGGDNLIVMAMSQDRGGEEQIREFFDEIEVTSLGVFSDPVQKVSRDFHVLGLPTTYIIDHDGNLVAKLVGVAEWDGEAALSLILPLVEQAKSKSDGEVPEQASLEVEP